MYVLQQIGSQQYIQTCKYSVGHTAILTIRPISNVAHEAQLQHCQP